MSRSHAKRATLHFACLSFTLCMLVLALVGTATGATLYVTVNSPTIQDAINAAADGDEIEVAPGTYVEAINFNGKAIRLYSSGGPDVTTIDGNGAYHVVQCVSGEGSGTILEGFTITGGNANGESPNNSGGGMYCYDSSPTVTNCSFSGNTATSGGGMYSWNWSQPTVTDCTFSGNSASYAGGGLVIYWNSAATISGCTFSGNQVTGGSGCNGGGLSVSWDLGTTVTNCTFTGNSASYHGGAMFTGNQYPTAPPTELMNCTFIGNSAQTGGGGAMYNFQSGPEITNCTFADNTADWLGGAILTYYGGEVPKMIPTVTNCILWGDTPPEIFEWALGGDPPITTVNYSDVEGGYAGTGNIKDDPMFVSAAEGNFRLSWGSPCIDAGDNTAVPADITTDLDGKPRIVNDTVDMGAYEYPIILVQIDIKPGSDPNSINLCSDGAVPIAILGSNTFSVSDIYTETLRFAEAAVKVVGRKDPHALCSVEDVNGDMFDDLVCHYLTTDIAAIDGESTTATLNGELFDGTPFEGTDSVNIVKDTCQ